VDSSVWIEYFNNGNPASKILSNLIDNNSLCVNDLILAELIPFIKHSGESNLVELLYSINRVEIHINWEKIIQYQILNLRKGINAVGISDLIIMHNVIENNLTLFAFDKHFSLMKEIHKYKLFEY